MASHGEIQIRNTDTTLFAGAAFLLAQPADISVAAVLPNRTELQISQEKPYAIVRLSNSPEEVGFF
jgi:hypothetical protein